jgi:hypothetical protein
MAIENMKKHLISSGDIYIYIYIYSQQGKRATLIYPCIIPLTNVLDQKVAN